MSSHFTKISGNQIRSMLRSRGLPGGKEKACCGGRKTFNRDYASQLKALGMRGAFEITEGGAVVDQVLVN